MKTLADPKHRVNQEFYHPNLAHLRAIAKRGFASGNTINFNLVRRTVPMPALLAFAGYPLASHQYCFKHKGEKGRALSIFPHQQGEFWYFHCNNPLCGVSGDVSEMWHQIVHWAGLAPTNGSAPYAAADLLARVESGEIDTSIRELELTGAGTPTPAQPATLRARLMKRYGDRLRELCLTPRPGASSLHLLARPLPEPVQIGIRQVIPALFPEDGLLLITERVDWQKHNIRRRDDWLQLESRTLSHFSFISSSYLRRADLKSSYAAFRRRRWLVIESDRGTLEEQFAIHTALAKRRAHLGCVCYSGGKSMHGWYLVKGWTERQCFQLYAAAIGLGISDCATYSIRQPVRLPGGWNAKTNRRQSIYLWNL